MMSPANQLTKGLTNQRRNEQMNQPTNQPINQPTNQPTNHPTNQPTNHSAHKPYTFEWRKDNRFFSCINKGGVQLIYISLEINTTVNCHRTTYSASGRLQRRATKLIPERRDLSYAELLKEFGLTILDK